MAQPISSLWRNSNFLKLWTAKTVSDFGSLISGTALSFTAILFLKATPFQLSLLMIANLLPKFLTGLIAGVWIDRLPRRPVMVFADIGRALLLLSIPITASIGKLNLAQLYGVTLGTGLLTLFFDLADRSYLPLLVPPESLIEANSKLTATSSVAEFSAFSLGGWLVQSLSAPFAVLIDAITFLVSASFLGVIRKAEPRPTPPDSPTGVYTELKEGWMTVWGHPLLASLAVSTLLIGFSFGMIGTVIVAFMSRDLGFAPGILGMIWALGGISSLAGVSLASPISRRFGIGRSLVGGLFFAGVGMLVVSLGRGATAWSVVLLIANQLITDPAYTLYEINQVSLRQALVPERLQGRMNGTLEFLGLGTTLLGALLGGVLGQSQGLRTTLIFGAGVMLLASLCLSLSPMRRLKELPKMEA